MVWLRMYDHVARNCAADAAIGSHIRSVSGSGVGGTLLAKCVCFENRAKAELYVGGTFPNI
jgi:hypothetical protein